MNEPNRSVAEEKERAEGMANRKAHTDDSRIDSRVAAVRHRADEQSGSHPLGQVTAPARSRSVQAGALGLLIGALIALIALIARRRAR